MSNDLRGPHGPLTGVLHSLIGVFTTNDDKFHKVVTSIQENLGDSSPSRYILHPTNAPDARPIPLPLEASPSGQDPRCHP